MGFVLGKGGPQLSQFAQFAKIAKALVFVAMLQFFVPVARAQVPGAHCRVFLVPGAFGAGTSSLFLKLENYFQDYRDFFAEKGCEVKTAEFPPDATIETRALILKDQLSRFSKAGDPLYLVAHSQGALDARFAIRTLGLPGVDVLISIGAPHAGTPMAEWAVDQRSRGTFLYWVLRLIGGYDLRALSFAGEMTPEFLQAHLAQFEPKPGVRYASAQGVCHTGCHRALRALAEWVDSERLGPGHGDGIVPRDSQSWGDDLGEYDLDHISEVGSEPSKHAERVKFLERTWSYLTR
jgi:hypothetical protein